MKIIPQTTLDKLTANPALVEQLFGVEIREAEQVLATKADLRAKIDAARRAQGELEPQIKPGHEACARQQEVVLAEQAKLYELSNRLAATRSRLQDLRFAIRQWQDELAVLENPPPKGAILRSAYTGGGPAL